MAEIPAFGQMILFVQEGLLGMFEAFVHANAFSCRSAGVQAARLVVWPMWPTSGLTLDEHLDTQLFFEFWLESLCNYRSPTGVQVDIRCPPGRFFTGLLCGLCGPGFYCPGGSKNVASRFSCRSGETTLSNNASSREDCVCDRGHSPSSSDTCVECASGWYKLDAGNGQCAKCPANQTTHTTGAVSDKWCVAVFHETLEEKNSSTVPAVNFDISLHLESWTPWSNETQGLLSPELGSLIRRSISQSTRLATVAIDLEYASGGTAVRRLSQTVVVTVVLKRPTEALAKLTEQELDVTVLLSELQTDLRASGSGIEAQLASDPVISFVLVRCQAGAAVPPGITVLHPDDCKCRRGYGYDDTLRKCNPCPKGQYKSSIANSRCLKCDASRTTLTEGETSAFACKCEAVLHFGNCTHFFP